MRRVGQSRRLRGILLRLVLNRPLTMLVGVVVMAPAVWLLWTDAAWESGVTDGLALIALATGGALAWTGVTGRQADWIDPDS
jgi:hypothetical protein